MCTRLHKYRVMRRLQLPHAHVLELEDGSFPKESIKKYMDELTESARIIGAVNTAVFPAAILEHHGAPWSTTALGETELCGKLKEIEQPQPTSQGDKEEGAVFRRQHCLHLKVILSVVKCHTLASFHIACFSMLPSMVSFASRIGLESRIRWKCEWDNKASEDNWSPEMLLL